MERTTCDGDFVLPPLGLARTRKACDGTVVARLCAGSSALVSAPILQIIHETAGLTTVSSPLNIIQAQLAQLAAERSDAAAAAKRGQEDTTRLEKQLADARRKVCPSFSLLVNSWVWVVSINYIYCAGGDGGVKSFVVLGVCIWRMSLTKCGGRMHAVAVRV